MQYWEVTTTTGIALALYPTVSNLTRAPSTMEQIFKVRDEIVHESEFTLSLVRSKLKLAFGTTSDCSGQKHFFEITSEIAFRKRRFRLL
jgi:hypothetical protein